MSAHFKFGKASGGEPLPTLPIKLLDDNGNVMTKAEITAIVDTGSDGTIIPIAILKAAGFRPNRQRRNLFTVQFSTVEKLSDEKEDELQAAFQARRLQYAHAMP